MTMRKFCIQTKKSDLLQHSLCDSEHKSLYRELREAFCSRDNTVKTVSALMTKANVCMNNSLSDMMHVSVLSSGSA